MTQHVFAALTRDRVNCQLSAQQRKVCQILWAAVEILLKKAQENAK